MDHAWLFGLLVVFQVKHFLADFPLQGEYMLQKVSGEWDFVLPLGVHCAVHGAMTLAIVMAVDTQLWWLALVDFVIHFVMDRIKSGPRYFGRFNDKSRPAFWNVLGFDQMVHHLTSFYIVWVLIQSKAAG
jgi:hypothetical protein